MLPHLGGASVGSGGATLARGSSSTKSITRSSGVAGSANDAAKNMVAASGFGPIGAWVRLCDTATRGRFKHIHTLIKT